MLFIILTVAIKYNYDIMNEVQEKVKSIIARTLKIDDKEINMNTEFRGDLNTNNLTLITLIFNVEKEFDITFSRITAMYRTLKTVSDLCRLVEKHVN